MNKSIDIEGYIGRYNITDSGDVISLITGKKLKPDIGKSGYGYVRLYDVYGKVKSHMIHRLVAKAFIPNPNNLPCVCHKDDDKLNNKSSNLFWGTHQDNSSDMISKGRQTKGEDVNTAVLTEEDIPVIWERLMEKEFSAKIARDYGLSRSTINRIKQGKSWKHITSKLKPLNL